MFQMVSSQRLLVFPSAAWPLLLCCMLQSATSHANDIDVRLESENAAGQSPAVVVDVRKAMASAFLDLRAGNVPLQKRHGQAKPGDQIRFPLPHRAQGQMLWAGTLSVRFVDGTEGTMDLQFETAILAPLTLEVTGNRHDIVVEHKVRATVGAGAEFVRVEVFGEHGERLANVERDAGTFEKNTPFVLAFSPAETSAIVLVRVSAGDSQGRSIVHELYPWELRIPHEEVMFSSGKSEILPSESPKLDRSLIGVNEAIQRYEKALAISQNPVRLFISGHTDTVGARDKNQILSDQRAHAIARWFRSAGVKLPIFYRGWGESQLRVPTNDEVDQAENRRADYILSIEPPVGTLQEWKKIP